MKILYPEQYAESASQVDYEALRQKGVRLLLFDKSDRSHVVL